VPSGPLNLLLLGLDTRDGRPMTASRADTIFMVHNPASRDRAYVISVERDTVKALFAAATTQHLTRDPVSLNRLVMAAGDSLVVDPGRFSTVELVRALAGVQTLIGIESPARAGSHGDEQTPAEPAASQLFDAMRTDSVDQWALSHPSAVS
jgi:hypothetical protein